MRAKDRYRAHSALRDGIPPVRAIYNSGRAQYPPAAYYLPGLWLFWFFRVSISPFSANAWRRAHRTLHYGTPPVRAICNSGWKQRPPCAHNLLALWLLVFDFLSSIFLLTLGAERSAYYMTEPHQRALYIIVGGCIIRLWPIFCGRFGILVF